MIDPAFLSPWQPHLCKGQLSVGVGTPPMGRRQNKLFTLSVLQSAGSTARNTETSTPTRTNRNMTLLKVVPYRWVPTHAKKSHLILPPMSAFETKSDMQISTGWARGT